MLYIYIFIIIFKLVFFCQPPCMAASSAEISRLLVTVIAVKQICSFFPIKIIFLQKHSLGGVQTLVI